MTRATTKTLILVLAAATAACRTPGPALVLRNPDGHEVFLDGRRVLRARKTGDDEAPRGGAQEPEVPAQQAPEAQPTHVELPFRYYGASRWDVLPNVVEDNGVPVFDARPRSEAVELPAPVSPWLFPLDLPIEAVDRLLFGRRDVDVIVTARTRANAQGPIQPEEFEQLSARARAARGVR